MTKAQFLGLRRQGFTLEFVNYGEDIKVRISSGYGDATYKKGGFAYGPKKIKVRAVNCGEDVRLSESRYGVADFEAV